MTRNLVGVMVSVLTVGFLALGDAPAAPQQSSAASGAASGTASGAITDASRAETVRFLTDLVKVDTSNPPGNEVKAANYIKAVLDKEGIALENF